MCYSSLLAGEHKIYMITFGYGQRAMREVERARYFAKTLKALDHKVIDISFMKSLYGDSNALTDKSQKLSSEFAQNLVVPLRNAVFIALAAAWAMSIGARVVAYGAHRGDTEHYPDCRPEFVKAMNEALNIAESDSISTGERQEIRILSPAMANLDKPALLTAGFGKLGDQIFRTWSCYSNGIRSGREYLHCGRCESCINRKNAFIRAQIKDKTRYASKSGSK